MRSWIRTGIVALASTCAMVPSESGAEPRPAKPRSDAEETSTLKGRVGIDFVTRLLRSNDPRERLRAIERAGSLDTKEGAFLLSSLAETSASAFGLQSDPRAALALARALARYDDERARTGLFALLGVSAQSSVDRLPSPSGAVAPPDSGREPRIAWARETAAIALACSKNERALSQLVSLARGSGSAQEAAVVGLLRCPPEASDPYGPRSDMLPPAFVRFLAQSGDLRALPLLLGAAKSESVATRAAALVALGELGDQRGLAAARDALGRADVRLRVAAAEALFLLDALDKLAIARALVADEATTSAGLRLSEGIDDPALVSRIAAKAAQGDEDVRTAAIVALGRSRQEAAATALASKEIFERSPYEPLVALARSPAENAMTLIARLVDGPNRRLAVRAYVVRALLRNERSSHVEDVISALAKSADDGDRALGAFARVTLGRGGVEPWLRDRSANVRRGAAMGVLAHPDPSSLRALAARYRGEPDEAARTAMAIGLLDGDPAGNVPTSFLIERADGGGADAPLAVFALTMRADRSFAARIEKYLSSSNPLLRSHAARGLAEAPIEDATGRLASAYAYEADVDVRRAVIDALGRRRSDVGAPVRERVLAQARDLDPDAVVASIARRALAAEHARRVAERAPALEDGDVLFVRLASEGRAPTGPSYLGSVTREGGLAVPIAFDGEGFAVVPGVSRGDTRLVLAPRLAPYEAPPP